MMFSVLTNCTSFLTGGPDTVLDTLSPLQLFVSTKSFGAPVL